jgi:hypothetical protein
MALCVPTGFTHVTDFQGHVLDKITTGNNVVNNKIVIGFTRNVPTTVNQLVN